MAVLLRCAACGADVEFVDDKPSTESVCPGCEVHVRRRPGDAEMAIPVSMALPDEFRHIDLDEVAKHSDLLVERYRKPSPGPENPAVDKDAMMAQALASLANAVARLEDRLDPEAEAQTALNDARKMVYPRSGKKNRRRTEGSDQVRVVSEEEAGLNGHGSSEDEVVHLSEHEHSAKATPLEARLLVRREAAAVAHHFERKSQSAYDKRGREQVKQNWFSSLMEKHPVITVVCTLVPTVALVGYVIYWMYMDSLLESPTSAAPAVLERGEMSQRYEADPAAATAELVAHVFLTAPSAEKARSVVYRYEDIADKFDQLFEPYKSPGEYELTPKGQQVMADGTKVYAFGVSGKDQDPRTLVVLPEGKMPKVHWEFFAEVGDMSWDEFLTQKPASAVMLRAFVQKGDFYASPYNEDEWTSYLVHDRSQRHVVQAFARRGSGADWNLDNAIKTDPVKFERFSAVRAQVEMSFMARVDVTGGGQMNVAEIKDVRSTSWLPKRFVVKKPVK